VWPGASRDGRNMAPSGRRKGKKQVSWFQGFNVAAVTQPLKR
jgi:hypothetical protein